MTFHVGQKIVCVDDSRRIPNKLAAALWIRRGAIYTVRDFGECPYPPWRRCGKAVWLEGIVRDGGPNWPDFPFDANRFRPIVERKTDINIFTAMLDKVPHIETVT